MGEAGLDLHFRPGMNENDCVAAVETGGKQQSPGLLHLEWFKSLILHSPNKKDILSDVLFIWWARRDLNPHVRSEH